MAFDQNVFINCPFDEEYRQLLLGITFTIIYFGYNPRLSLESSDSSETRIHKIVRLIDESKFGIHDISRMISSSADEISRMNMPFELGIDYGCKQLKGRQWNTKKILILDKEKYRFHKAISDLSGSDIKHHNNEVVKAIICVRNWFVTEELGRGYSGAHVWGQWNEFQTYLYEEVVENDGHLSVDDVEIMEIIHHMRNWKLSLN